MDGGGPGDSGWDARLGERDFCFLRLFMDGAEVGRGESALSAVAGWNRLEDVLHDS